LKFTNGQKREALSENPSGADINQLVLKGLDFTTKAKEGINQGDLGEGRRAVQEERGEEVGITVECVDGKEKTALVHLGAEVRGGGGRLASSSACFRLLTARLHQQVLGVMKRSEACLCLLPVDPPQTYSRDPDLSRSKEEEHESKNPNTSLDGDMRLLETRYEREWDEYGAQVVILQGSLVRSNLQGLPAGRIWR
jgi:hypothetical protein